LRTVSVTNRPTFYMFCIFHCATIRLCIDQRHNCDAATGTDESEAV